MSDTCEPFWKAPSLWHDNSHPKITILLKIINILEKNGGKCHIELRVNLEKFYKIFPFEQKRIWEFGLTFDRVSLIGKWVIFENFENFWIFKYIRSGRDDAIIYIV